MDSQIFPIPQSPFWQLCTDARHKELFPTRIKSLASLFNQRQWLYLDFIMPRNGLFPECRASTYKEALKMQPFLGYKSVFLSNQEVPHRRRRISILKWWWKMFFTLLKFFVKPKQLGLPWLAINFLYPLWCPKIMLANLAQCCERASLA